MQLLNEKAIVTGGSQGIGKGIAIALAKAGADVVIQYHTAKDKAEVVVDQIKKIGREAIALQADFTEDTAPALFIEQAMKHCKTANILVNCAAAYGRGPLLDVTAKQFAWMHKVNVEAPFRLIQLFAQQLIEKKAAGSIINISSISGGTPSVGSCLNSCSKAGLNMLTRSAALELAPHNIRVNSIAPGTTETESNEPYIKQDPEFWEQVTKAIPLKRIGLPSDYTDLVVLLASDASSWITGVNIPCDGGMTISWQ